MKRAYLLFVWSTMQGLASVLKSPVLGSLGLPRSRLARAVPTTLERVGGALDATGGRLGKARRVL